MRATAIVVGLVMVAGTACGPGGDGAGGAEIGEVTAELQLAPTDARCVVFAVARGNQTTTRAFDVAPQSSSVFNLLGLPLGNSTITVTAFTVACDQRTGVAPTWRSNAVDVTLTGANPVSAMFVMVDLREMGQVIASVDFPARRHGVITEFSLPDGGGSPIEITTGPDGNLWFAETPSFVTRLTTSGVATRFPVDLATFNLDPSGIAAGPDGNLWFTMQQGVFGNSNKIARITTDGVVTGAFGASTVDHDLAIIAAGPDGNMWASLFSSDQLARVTVQGVVTKFSFTPGAGVFGVASGVDGNIWFTERLLNKIGRITPAGAVTEFALPTMGSAPRKIVSGSDGNLWFAEAGRAVVGRISLTGAVTEFALSAPARGIAAGPDGNVWVTEGDAIGRVTVAGVATEFALSPGSGAEGITAGPDGNVWFTEFVTQKVGRITP